MSPDRPSKSDDVQRAVIDRITGEWAVLLVGDHEQERRVKADDLPGGAKEGSIVEVRVSPMKVEVLSVDDGATQEQRAETKDRMNRLKQERPSSRFTTEK